ncbi:hypothetical protein [Saccharothrix syringae]|uniref:Peptidase inhibitor family I36 protein n=1 Tax=Saccharothrix syringae TaxID=103733 RepID=A0A5Q0H5X7_SACSY|nr:hypothetical protein [Saccharothrix syringae]QFZ21344.1 hypothetical protein EKG83_31660 [Saccharothrix syringae]
MKAVRTALCAVFAVLALTASTASTAHASAAPEPTCAVLAPYDFECVFVGVVKGRVFLDPVAQRATTQVYLGHSLFGWQKVAEATWPRSRVQAATCGTAFNHTACLYTDFNWSERFVSLRATYDEREIGNWRFTW